MVMLVTNEMPQRQKQRTRRDILDIDGSDIEFLNNQALIFMQVNSLLVPKNGFHQNVSFPMALPEPSKPFRKNSHLILPI